jgi:hypothetical protein
VVGDISSDSVYNGDIKFYDSATDLLSEEAEYKNGLLNGKRTNYYRNGKVFSILNYEYGKNVGYNRYYDSFGSLESKDYFYYDFKVGPSISYVSGEPKIYDFYAFDNNLIYSLDYDSLKGNIITNLEKDFFHIISYDSVEYFDGNKSSVGLKFLIYQLNPPKYDFNYDVVLIDSAYNVIRVVNKLNSNFPFCFFGVPNLKEGKYFYALRLEVFDSLNAKSNYLMFKKLR